MVGVELQLCRATFVVELAADRRKRAARAAFESIELLDRRAAEAEHECGKWGSI